MLMLTCAALIHWLMYFWSIILSFKIDIFWCQGGDRHNMRCLGLNSELETKPVSFLGAYSKQAVGKKCENASLR